jgi:hypothetical protein
MHVLWNTGRRVQGNRGPDDVDILLSDPMATKEIASSVRTIDFEPLTGAAVSMGQAHVVKHRAGIK